AGGLRGTKEDIRHKHSSKRDWGTLAAGWHTAFSRHDGAGHQLRIHCIIILNRRGWSKGRVLQFPESRIQAVIEERQQSSYTKTINSRRWRINKRESGGAEKGKWTTAAALTTWEAVFRL